MIAKHGVSERFACRVLSPQRSTLRKKLGTPDDEAALTANIMALAIQYGRYGYQRITAILRSRNWRVSAKRVARISRCGGLKVPAKQTKMGLALAIDGLCVRLLQEHPNHVWSYHFLEDCTHDGRKYRSSTSLTNLRANVSRSGSIKDGRRQTSSICCRTLSSFAAFRATFGPTMAQSFSPKVCVNRLLLWGEDRLHHARKPMGERQLRALQLEAP